MAPFSQIVEPPQNPGRFKVFPKEQSENHKSLNDFLYSQLKNKRWGLVSSLRNFSLSGPMTRDISDIDRKIRTVNIAIAYKNLGQDSAAHKLLDQEDWTATYRDFKLAVAILSEQWSHASEIMESIGREGELVDQDAYHSWPLFVEFRKTSEFHASYEKIYGESFYENLNSQGMEKEDSAGPRRLKDPAGVTERIADRDQRGPTADKRG
jgi:hypothetical protein